MLLNINFPWAILLLNFLPNICFSQIYDCPSVSIVSDNNFQQTSIRFQQETGGYVITNLHSNNPYNELSIPFSEKDDAYNMSIYDLSTYSDSIKRSVLYNVFPYQEPNTDISAINSMASVQLNNECTVHLNYTVFGFGDGEDILAVSSTSLIYDFSGNLIGVVNGQNWGNAQCEISKDASLMICISGFSPTREQEGGGTLRVIKIKENRTLYEVDFSANEHISGIGRVRNSDVYICTIDKRPFRGIPIGDKTTLIFTPSERTIRKYSYTDYCSTLGYWPIGVVAYLDEKREKKINVRWETLPIIGRF